MHLLERGPILTDHKLKDEKNHVEELQKQLEEMKRDELKKKFLLNKLEMQLEDAKSDMKRLTGRTAEVPALEDALKMAREERDAALKRTFDEKSKGFEENLKHHLENSGHQKQQQERVLKFQKCADDQNGLEEMVSNTRTAFAQKIQEKEEVIAKQREEEERLRQEGCILHHHNATLNQQLQETQSEKYAAEEEIEQARNRIRQLEDTHNKALKC